MATYMISVHVEDPSPALSVVPIESDNSLAAKIVEGLKDKTFAEGEDIVLRCRVEGKPTPTGKYFLTYYAYHLSPLSIYYTFLVMWSLGDEQIWSGPPDEGGLSELILKDCWSDDMGVYKIQVSNDHGKDESTCNVIVQQRLKVINCGVLVDQFYTFQ